ncbi:family 43 glycosylhydrolase [Cohnella caldifontis]|uniref:family 43 glycosylhydrolase n=1 Tax=Cohnella caldifontis TaxID=3027471 RepID=UPI0023ED30B8|nr:family 43 glycosylhydrolase [Cohnella sp. YIM B05605]
MFRIAIVALALLSALAGCAKEAPPADYANPVFRPVFADPSVLKADDGYYYAYGTEDAWDDGLVHLIPVIRSADLSHWEFVRDAFDIKPLWKDDGGLWAPDISRHKDGNYYLYYAFSLWGDPNPGIGVATADRLEGPFTDRGKLFDSDGIGVANSIDPFYYEDDDGKAYLFWGSFHGIYGIELSEDGLHTVGEKFPVADIQYEAPYIVKRDGNYYFFGSSGSCCEGAFSTYNVKIGRAKSIRGPYLDRDGVDLASGGGTPLLQANPDGEGKRFVGPGHNAVIADDRGRDWIVYHAIDPDDPTIMNGATKRPLMIDPLEWKDGWPAVPGGEPGTSPRPGPYVKKKNG